MPMHGRQLSATGAAICGVAAVFAAVTVAGGLNAANTPDDPREMLRATLVAQGVDELAPPPSHPETLVELGRLLFFDPELSGNRNISCGTCHNHELFSADGLSLGVGEGGVGLGPKRTTGTGPTRAERRMSRHTRSTPYSRT